MIVPVIVPPGSPAFRASVVGAFAAAEIRVDPDQMGIERGMMDFVNGKPFETIGCPNCSSASMTI